MADKGDPYEELVGEIQRALDLGAQVEVGIWVVGPDGRRDCDVRIRGTANGKPQFILVECKDWTDDTVGIDVVDALDSKMRDLGADRGAIFARKFTEGAKRKARRLGIGIATPMKQGDDRVRFRLVLPYYAKVHSIRRYSIAVDCPSAPPFQPHELECDGYSMLPWLARKASEALRSLDKLRDFSLSLQGFSSAPISIRSVPYNVNIIVVNCECESYMVKQDVPQDVTLGYFDQLKIGVVVPPGASWTLGDINNLAWERTEDKLAELELELDEFNIGILLWRGIHVEGMCSSRLDELSLIYRVDL